MTNYVLEIKLLSPLTSAAGEGRVGLVDRDIATWGCLFSQVDGLKVCGARLIVM